MSERLEMLRQQARAEAAEHEQRLAAALAIQPPKRTPHGRGAAAYGDTSCPRCGVRSSIGCAHRPKGDTSTRLSSHDQRGSLV